ncbi:MULTISPECIES: GntR family transcriptional regulator [Pseudonocardia]|uniref:GntR family transcriptional regulator n=2 Tax=Pseudonocardia TaxID=1847 RepID=A0ABQ0S6S5_9PSEU|nr:MULTISPECIES: GntR family transcriptional regulator [Pseudonocardia]OSY36939.1 putative HTH-type transcriptional regulator YdfH [Pseudonocardia autotrophica]TDN75622.1 GntR family transcriptional regulator [Pseudonocardia autotrophica]BBF99593.1 GntR family transcriptional regulator [Pseudonocardia autotrophica]GEC28612.1 GntR family transcriptional regulator [Pseudonocardia saturnea]
MVVPPAAVIPEGEPPPPLREQVYVALRDAVLNGEFRAGERLTEPKLAKRYGMSRTPVRDAVTRLLADGLLHREDYGYSVVVPSVARVRDLYEVRIAVELRGIARCIENPGVRHDPAVLGTELEYWHGLRAAPPGPAPEFVLADERYHAALLSASGNAELVAVLADVNSRIRRVRMHDFVVPGRIETSIDEHIEIAERILDGRLETAHRLLHEHIGASLEDVVERVTRALVAMNARETGPPARR